MSWPHCICFGDSITQRGWDYEGGWLSILGSTFQRRVDFVNRGFSGYTTRLCLPLIKQLYPRSESLSNCCAFLIFLGANDASMNEQMVPLDEYKSNLMSMVAHLVNLGLENKKIILISPPPVDEIFKEPNCIAQGKPFTRTFTNTMAYAEECVAVAVSSGVEKINLFTALAAQRDWQNYLIDGLHFNRRGSEFFSKLMTPIIENKTSCSDIIYPDWRDALKLDLSEPIPF